MSLLYRQLIERKKEEYQIKLLGYIRKYFMKRKRKEKFVREFIHVIMQHKLTDDIYHYLCDCCVNNFLDTIILLLDYGYLDVLCLDCCYQYVRGYGPCPSPHEFDMS